MKAGDKVKVVKYAMYMSQYLQPGCTGRILEANDDYVEVEMTISPFPDEENVWVFYPNELELIQ